MSVEDLLNFFCADFEPLYGFSFKNFLKRSMITIELVWPILMKIATQYLT